LTCDSFEKESLLLGSINCDNIAKIYGVCLSASRPKLIMEYCEYGSLEKLLKSNILFGWKEFFRFSIEISKAIQYLHAISFVVKDITSSNFLLSSDWTIKLVDFGISNSINDELQCQPRRPQLVFLSPDIILSGCYSFASDIYALSLVFWQMLFRCAQGRFSSIYGEYLNLRYDYEILVFVVRRNLRPSIPPYSITSVSDIITEGWNADPNQRPTINEVLIRLLKSKALFKSMKGNIDLINKGPYYL